MTRRTLMMDVKVGETLSIDGGRLIVTLEHKSGQRARLRFVHAGDVNVEHGAPAAPAAAPCGVEIACTKN